MEYLFIITSIGFFLWVVRNTLFWVELWQSKEYRMDRLFVHLRETIQGKRLLVSPISFTKWILLLGYSVGALHTVFAIWYAVAIAIVYCIEGIRVFFEIISGYRFRRPVRTVKALCISFLSLLIIVVLYFIPLLDPFVWFVVLDRLQIIIIVLFVFFFAFPTKIYIKRRIKQAKEHMKKQKKLSVIAVSGSYGKSSTKEFIAQVLQEKYTVVKTFGSNNTPIGIANAILGRITDETEIFVVEMGAYKKGEVAQLCDIVPPNISVTTSVSDQHLSLYGSIKNAIDTEVELINSLPENGLALFNGNNVNTKKLYEKTKKKKVLYIVETGLKPVSTADIIATNVIQEKQEVSFSVVINKKKIQYKAPLLGIHMIENILPAIYIATHLKIPDASIKKAIAALIPPPKTMTRKILSNGVILIDDTFNASPESVQAAMQYMQVYKKKKILVLMPLVELGKHAKQRHYEIGQQTATLCDYLFVTNKNYYKQMKKGIEANKGTCKIYFKKTPQLIEAIISIAKKEDVVLFEGKEAGKVLQGLL